MKKETLKKSRRREELKDFVLKSEEITSKPEEGKWFVVTPLSINKSLFQKEREDQRQEHARKLILEAFNVLNEDPEKYGKPFKIMVPAKTWNYMSVGDLIQIGHLIGNHITDWVEQCLEWAQRISNSESWEDICNKPDTLNWVRLVIWKFGYVRIIGGSAKLGGKNSATDIYSSYNGNYSVFKDAVPSVVEYL